MATYYYDFEHGSAADNTPPTNGTAWATPFKTFKYALETVSAIAEGPHVLMCASSSTEDLTQDTTATAAGDIRIISANTGTSAPEVGCVVGAQSTNYSVTLNGGFEVYVYGLTFTLGTSTSSSRTMTISGTDGSHFEMESCVFSITGGSSSVLQLGGGGSVANVFLKLVNCTQKAGNAGHTVRPLGVGEAINYTIDAAGTAQTVQFGNAGSAAGIRWTFVGSDLSKCAGTLVGDFAANGTAQLKFVDCKVAAATFLAVPSAVLNRGHTEVWMFNCASGDTHYNFYHGDAFGETMAVTTYYADDGASYDGTNRCSWKITTRASNCSFYTPYVSPWIDQYHAGTSAVTLTLEGLRVDSTTVIQNDEVWGEFSAQATSGVPLATISSDRMALLGTPANQTSSKAYSDWTGDPTDTDSGDSAFALVSGSVTPAEIGHFRARVVVGEPGLTVYIDPKIRVA